MITIAKYKSSKNYKAWDIYTEHTQIWCALIDMLHQ